MERKEIHAKVMHPLGSWLDLVGYDDFVGRAWQGNTFWEKGNLLEMCKLIPRGAGREYTIVDCGANLGNHTVFFAGFGFSVVAFEAFTDTWRKLLDNVIKNEFLVTPTVFKSILWDKSNVPMKCIELPNCGGNSFVECELDDPDCCGSSMRLDDYMLTSCDMIKIDVEGAELRLLQGAVETLKKFKPTIWLEVHTPPVRRAEVSMFFKDIGYRGKVVMKGGK